MKNQQKALHVILDGFQIPYEEEPETDEAERILSNPKMAERLEYKHREYRRTERNGY